MTIKSIATLLLFWLFCFQAVAVVGATPLATGNPSKTESGATCHEATSQTLVTTALVLKAPSEDLSEKVHRGHEDHPTDLKMAGSDCCHLGCGCCVMGCHSLASSALSRLSVPSALPLFIKVSSALPEGPADTPYRPPILA